MRLKLGVLTALVLCSTVPGASALDSASAPPSARSNACRSLPVTATLRSYLRAAHRRVNTQRFSGPAAKSTYYGRCGTTYYALAAFKHLVVGYTDQPEAFRRPTGKIWRDIGDTGGDVCGSHKAPSSLIRVWKIRCT